MTKLVIRKAEPSDIPKLVELGLSLQLHCEKSNPFIWHITEEGKQLLKQRFEDALKDDKSRILTA